MGVSTHSRCGAHDTCCGCIKCRLAKLFKVCSMAAPEHGEGIFAELEERVQALYRPYLPKGVPERILLLLISFIQACPGLA